jgi:hypothetical protein
MTVDLIELGIEVTDPVYQDCIRETIIGMDPASLESTVNKIVTPRLLYKDQVVYPGKVLII